ncbi:hypothetical protein [Lysobacter hankyongensis]|uniref:Uncharacterized protein n=1 Tax=Lysobacter hankyongensis TaxID=1176535 RepID=A0ABP9BLD4_9GAMM
MPGILDASLQVATALITSMSASEKEHEETLTGTLLGSLLASNSLLAMLTAHLNVYPSQCWWGSYSKYRSKETDKTEAGSGADFALLTLLEMGGARLTIFQAKRGELDGETWTFDANRVPQPPKNHAGEQRAAQMVVLVETARRLSALARSGTEVVVSRESAKSEMLEGMSEEMAAKLHGFDWIHYLIYTAEEPKCIALEHMSSAYIKELIGIRKKTPVDLTEENCERFTALVLRGSGTDGRGWLEFKDAATAISALPHLLPLVPVVVGDGTGSHGPALQEDFGLKQLVLDLQSGPLADIVGKITAAPSRSGPRPSIKM